MNKRKNWIPVVLMILLFVTSCGRQQVYLETADTATTAEMEQQRSDTEAEDTSEITAGEAHVSAEEDAMAQICYVYVCGAVEKPGVYALRAKSRVYEAIIMAGGLREDACMESVNQAEVVCDGQMLKILTNEEAAETTVEDGQGQIEDEEADGRVNLNTASVTELMTLSGIGQAKAESIVSYREKNGSFSSIEDIMKIEGIKEGVFNRIKDSIRVK